MKLSELPKEEKFERILSVINTEFKSITWYCLDESWQTYCDLGKEFKRTVEEEYAVIPRENSFGAYCHFTFFPIGLVAEEKIRLKGRQNPVLHWKLTEDGEKYKPIAAFSIKTAVDFDLSMYQILGPTHTPGDSRSPYNRAKILMNLSEEENLRRVDLENNIGLDGENIQKHLLSLKKIGFVDYESVSMEEKGFSKYLWIKGKPKQVKAVTRSPILNRKVLEILYKSEKPLNRGKIAEELNYPDLSYISRILSGLEEQGFCKRVKFKGREKYSEANITEKGMESVQNFLDPVYNASEDYSLLKEMEKTLEEYENDNSLKINYFTKATKLYAKVCPAFKREPKKVIKTNILDILEEGSKRAKEINALIGKRCTKELKELCNENKIEKIRSGIRVYYKIKS